MVGYKKKEGEYGQLDRWMETMDGCIDRIKEITNDGWLDGQENKIKIDGWLDGQKLWMVACLGKN